MWIFDRTYFNVIYFKRNVFFNLFVLSSVILSSFFLFSDGSRPYTLSKGL